MKTLQTEREKASFDVKELTYILDGSKQKTETKVR